MSVSVKDTDRGYRQMLKLLTEKDRPILKVGIFGEKAAAGHENSQMTVGDIAAVHEFGLGNCPERSFVRGFCDENESKVVEFTKKECEEAVKSGADNFIKVLNRLGLYCVAGMQKRIADRIPPPLKDSTIQRKGSDVPLINTGQLRSSITYMLGDK